MQHMQVFEAIDKLTPHYIDVWTDICNIESPTKYKKGVDEVGEYFARFAAQKGWQVEYSKQEIAGDALCITMNPDAKAQPITLSGHMDTVYPQGAFGTPAVHRDEEKIYGPGVTDCKGGLVAALLAMDALDKCGYNSRPIQLLLQSDEEVGSSLSRKATINYICQKAKMSRAFLNLEGYTEGQACLQRKGIITFAFKVTGVEAHASRCARLGANAIAEAAHKILEIEKIKDNEGLTCCCSIISGGTTVNTVPNLCEFKVNVRFATAQQKDWICAFMQELADKTYIEGCRTTLTQDSFRVAMELTDKNTNLLKEFNACLEKCGMAPLAAAKRIGGSDAADVTAAGIPCLDSLGVRGENIHSANEFAYIESLAQSAKRIVSAAIYLD